MSKTCEFGKKNNKFPLEKNGVNIIIPEKQVPASIRPPQEINPSLKPHRAPEVSKKKERKQ